MRNPSTSHRSERTGKITRKEKQSRRGGDRVSITPPKRRRGVTLGRCETVLEKENEHCVGSHGGEEFSCNLRVIATLNHKAIPCSFSSQRHDRSKRRYFNAALLVVVKRCRLLRRQKRGGHKRCGVSFRTKQLQFTTLSNLLERVLLSYLGIVSVYARNFRCRRRLRCNGSWERDRGRYW